MYYVGHLRIILILVISLEDNGTLIGSNNLHDLFTLVIQVHLASGNYEKYS
jgi:hypothetical protein